MKLRPLYLIPAIIFFGIIHACKISEDKNTNTAQLLDGVWSFDSLSFGRDSNSLPFEYALYALVFEDSTKTTFRFDPDSVFTLRGDSTTESTAYKVEQDSLLVLGDGKGTTFHLTVVDTATIILSQRDTVSIFLKKQRHN